MFNLKNLFVISTLFWSGQSLMASVVDEDQWLIKPSTCSMWHGKVLKTNVRISPPLNSTSFVKEIVISECTMINGNKSGDTFHLKIQLNHHNDKSNELIDKFLNSNFNKKRLETLYVGAISHNQYICRKEKDFTSFLKIFHEANVIPDSVLDIIIPKLPMTDFRLDTEEFIQKFNKNFKDQISFKEFQKVMIRELDQIKYQKRRDQITWQIIKDLQNSKTNYDKNLIKLLCERIHFQSLFYIDAQKILVQLLVSELSDQSSIEELCKAPIINILEANVTEKNDFIKAFLNNGQPNSNDLPSELQNISLSANSMFNLLNYIRKLQNKTSD